MTWREKLIERRKAKGLTQREAGLLLGISQQSYGSYESGESTPSIEQVSRLAREWGFSLDWLTADQIGVPHDEYAKLIRDIAAIGVREAQTRILMPMKRPEEADRPPLPASIDLKPIGTETHDEVKAREARERQEAELAQSRSRKRHKG